MAGPTAPRRGSALAELIRPLRAEIVATGGAGRRFVDAMEECYRRAEAVAGGGRRHDFGVGSARLGLHLAGRGLEEAVLPAFGHLRQAPSAPGPRDLEVLLWDSASTGIAPPSPPWRERDFLARGEVRHDFEDEVRLSFRIDSGVLSVFDHRTGRAYCWVRDPAQLPPWEIAAPLRPILAWWAGVTGCQLAHGAAVGTSEGAVLLAARGGSGKSTTALSAIEQGMLYLGDDYVMLEPGEPLRVASLYCTAKLRPDNLSERLPQLASLIAGAVDPVQEKVTLALSGAFASQLTRSLPLRAIVVPCLAGPGGPAVERLPPAGILAALAPTTVFQLPGAGADALARMGRFVAGVPGYRLGLSTDLAANVNALRALICEEARPAS